MNEPHSDNKKLAARLDIMPMAVSLALILALIMLSRHIRGLGRILRGEEERKFRGR